MASTRGFARRATTWIFAGGCKQAGYWISFAPAAMVWHHRRQTPRTYFRQQAGYGEAEALLRFKHPDRFNGRGQGKWSGMLYGASLQGLVLDEAIIYRGTFGTSPFQCIYQPGPAHWAMIPSTLEWHMVVAAVLLLGFFWWPLFGVAGSMLLTSLIVAALQAWQARLAPCNESRKARMLIAVLCYVQPLVRAWARYERRYFLFPTPAAPSLEKPVKLSQRFLRTRTAAYWGSRSPERTQLIQRLLAYLDAHRCGTSIDTGWSEIDLYVFRDVWTAVSISTVQEEHGGGNRVIRVRCRLRTSMLTKTCIVLGATLVSLAACISLPVAAAWAAGIGLLLAGCWYRGAGLLVTLSEVVEELAGEMSLIRVRPDSEATKTSVLRTWCRLTFPFVGWTSESVPSSQTDSEVHPTEVVSHQVLSGQADHAGHASIAPDGAQRPSPSELEGRPMNDGAWRLPRESAAPVSSDCRWLIVNADDFGLSQGVNAGIVAAHERGIVTSASLMVRGSAAVEAVRMLRQGPGFPWDSISTLGNGASLTANGKRFTKSCRWTTQRQWRRKSAGSCSGSASWPVPIQRTSIRISMCIAAIPCVPSCWRWPRNSASPYGALHR